MAEQIDIDIVAHDKTSGIIQGIFQGIGQSMANFAMQLPGAIMNFGKSVLAEANEAQLGLADLQATLISTGGAAGMTEKELLALADSISKTTRFSDDAVLAGENMLLTFTNIGADVFPMATSALADIATKMKTDLPAAAIQLGKALNDPIAGISALTRIGVTFSDEQKNVIESLMKVGDVAGAQKVILAELNKEFGGQATAAAGTFSGQMDMLTNRFNDMKETVGMALIPVLSELIQRGIMPLVPYIESAAQAFADWLPNVIPIVTEFALAVYDGFQTYVMPAIRAFSEWWGINGGAIIEGAKGVWDAIVTGAGAVFTFLKDLLMPVFDSLSLWWGKNGEEIKEKAGKIWDGLTEGFLALSEKITKFINEDMPKIRAWFDENSPFFQEQGSKLWDGLIEATERMRESAGRLVEAFTGIGKTDEVIINSKLVWHGFKAFIEFTVDSIILVMDTLTLGISGAFDVISTVVEGGKESIQNFMEAFEALKSGDILGTLDGIRQGLQDIINLAYSTGQAILNAGQDVNNGIGGGLGNVLNYSGNDYSPESMSRAGGGSVAAGGSYLVGEQGAEMFVPNTSGQIIPNGGGSGAINITLNYAPSVALGNRQEAESSLLPYILSGIRAAQANGLLATV